ncbi:GTPase Obg-like [Octopus sinensis]|uniref:GTPase Obg-like n=1 Tax=Octopus sinensis TaxID=2607531 RepID=A0A6P7TWZ9_9MOLL|nr:GTPase Obg-like [Octopus sinensis]
MLAWFLIFIDSSKIGFPNAGKSSLLNSISRAKPRVSCIPFTTLMPQVGVVEFEDYRQITVADLPGLVKGSSVDGGLGFESLRHVERCRCLVFVLDLSLDLFRQFHDLKCQLEDYKEGLSRLPSFVVCNKVDLQDASRKFDEFVRLEDTQLTSVAVSAKFGIGIADFLTKLRSELFA